MRIHVLFGIGGGFYKITVYQDCSYVVKSAIKQFYMLKGNLVAKSTYSKLLTQEVSRQKPKSARSSCRKSKSIDHSNRMCPLQMGNNLNSPYLKGHAQALNRSQTTSVSQSNTKNKSCQNLFKQTKINNTDFTLVKNTNKCIKKVRAPGREKWAGLKKHIDMDETPSKLIFSRIEDSNQEIEVHFNTMGHKKSETSVLRERQYKNLRITLPQQKVQLIPTVPTQISFEECSPIKKEQPRDLAIQQVYSINFQTRQFENNEKIYLKKQLEKYQTQCHILEDELRETLFVIKEMNSQLQVIRQSSIIKHEVRVEAVQSVFHRICEVREPITVCLEPISQQKQKQQKKVSVKEVKNCNEKTKETEKQYQKREQGKKQSNPEQPPCPQQKPTTIIDHHLSPSPMVISINSSSPRVIRLGRNREYCKKGCTTYCTCLCESYSQTK